MNIQNQLTVLNQWPDRDGYQVEGIVVHSADGYFKGTVSWFKNPKAKVSTHYVISETGEIAKCVEENATAWHAGIVTTTKEKAPALIQSRWGINPNLITVGLELEDKRNRKWGYPNKQYQAAVELVADICKRHNLTASRDNIIMHKEIDPINRTDPIGDWKHDKFVQDVQRLLAVHKAGFLNVTVTAVKGLNVRKEAKTTAPKITAYPLGFSVYVKDWIEGEELFKNNKWWITVDDLYIWSGGTSLIPQDKKGKTMSQQEFEAKKAEFEAQGAQLDVRKSSLEIAEKNLVAEQEAYDRDYAEFVAKREEFLAQPLEVEAASEEAVVEAPVEEEPKVEEKVGFAIDDNMPSDVKDGLRIINSMLEKYKDYLKK